MSKHRLHWAGWGLLAILLLSGCGGGGGGANQSSASSVDFSSSSVQSSSLSSSDASSSSSSSSSSTSSAVALTRLDAYRFLNQATFGATESTAQQLMLLGDSATAYSRWIDQQLVIPARVNSLSYTIAAYPIPEPQGFNMSVLQAARVDQWFQNALNSDDQLRQRVAFALSQILVVSQTGALQHLPFATADYYDLLVRNAFGNYRDLLREMTLHPAMGVYLSMLGNRKASVTANLRPDENYARELMQLFSIGLVQLNIDGTPIIVDELALPTYNQSQIEGFARVFTGWNSDCPSNKPECTFDSTKLQRAPLSGFNQVKPMKLYPDEHETGTKTLLSYPGAKFTTLPAGQTGEKDLDDALDNLFNHPNVGPFIAKQLIQRLVTSNPSTDYVSRVAQTFNNDGTGQRGNLAAVVRAILLDQEARDPGTDRVAIAGKLKEPLLRITQFWRAYDARSASGKVIASANFFGGTFSAPAVALGQGPLQSPSVFNFYSPFYAPPGEIANQNWVAPEMQIATEYLNTTLSNFFWTQSAKRTTANSGLGAEVVYIDTREEIDLAVDASVLVNRVAEKLLGDSAQLPDAVKAQVIAQVNRSAASDAKTRVADAIYLIVSSPDFATQR